MLIDASKMGEEYKDGNIQKRRLRDYEIDQIVETFLNREAVDDFSVAVTYDEIKEKKYSLAAGQYFDVKIEYVELSQEPFIARMREYEESLQAYMIFPPEFPLPRRKLVMGIRLFHLVLYSIIIFCQMNYQI